MNASPIEPRRQTPRRWLLRAVVAGLAVWVFWASPVFLAVMALRITMQEMPMPRSIHRAPGLWGDAYLVDDDMDDGYLTLYGPWGNEICSPSGGHGGDGDGRCPSVMRDRWASIPVWSKDWIE